MCRTALLNFVLHVVSNKWLPIFLFKFCCHWLQSIGKHGISDNVALLDFNTTSDYAPTLSAGPLEAGVITPAAMQLLKYFYLPLEFHLCYTHRSAIWKHENSVGGGPWQTFVEVTSHTIFHSFLCKPDPALNQCCMHVLNSAFVKCQLCQQEWTQLDCNSTACSSAAQIPFVELYS